MGLVTTDKTRPDPDPDPDMVREPVPDAADKAVFDAPAALERTAGDRNVLAAVVGLFVDTWPQLDGDLEEACEAAHAERLAAIAHRLKGAALNLGADRLGDLAGDAELAWRASALADAASRIEELRKAFAAFEREARGYCARASDG